MTTDTAGNMQVSDSKGNITNIKSDKGGFDAKSSDGTEVHLDNGSMTSKDAKGNSTSVGASEVTESELGLPFYPGSNPFGHSDIKINSPGAEMYTSVRSTADAPEKVVGFYKDKVTKPQTMSSEKSAMVTGKLPNGHTAIISASVTDGKTQISVSVSSK